ncbi:hypothetical protein XELAEV_18004454mg [Xenopus laevis]|uniref:Uncharacterized protein n=1 Tax=Xenopus laevis TaxID=8355 RepID=A0A974GYX3_XENLA|nr:hypothetical protein XELAEV_18004454mg [Xenopus laevis]
MHTRCNYVSILFGERLFQQERDSTIEVEPIPTLISWIRLKGKFCCYIYQSYIVGAFVKFGQSVIASCI